MRSITILLCVLLMSNFISAQTIPTPTQTDQIIIDNGSVGKADPADRIRYTVTVLNTGGASATGVQLNAVPDLRTTFVAGSFKTSPLAINDNYAVTGNVGITIPSGTGLKANDFDDNVGALTLTTGTFATTGLGSITIAADGSFTYSPAAGFTGNDTYVYTLNDGDPVGVPVPMTDMGTVTFAVSNMIWFIDNSVAVSGTGTLASPFKNISNFNGSGLPAVGQVVFLKNTGTNYTEGIVLKNNMLFFGSGHSGGTNLADAGVLPFTLAANSPALPAIGSTRPIITSTTNNGILLAQGNTVRGVEVGSITGAFSKINGNNFGTATIGNNTTPDVSLGGVGQAINLTTGTLAATSKFVSVGSSSGANGVALTTVLGTFDAPAGTITGITGTAFFVSGGTVVISYGGTITGNSALAVDIDNHDSGNITFLTGNIVSATQGIRVQNCNGGTIAFNNPSKSLSTGANNAVNLLSNTGATINFGIGGLVTTTTGGVGFNATGGGTISVSGTTNTITSTTGSGMNVVSTTIGASNLNFLSISVNGAANGIVLNTTGAGGGLSVTGTGTTNGSGGTIQNITNRGVSATSTINLSLKNITFTNANTTDAAGCGAADNSGCNAAIYMNTVTNATLDNTDINGTAQQGINLKEVNGFTLTGATILNCGAGGQTEESDLYALNLFGTCAITNSSLTLPAERAAVIYNTNKTMALTVNGSTFGMNQTQPLGADGLEISAYGTSNHTIDIINSTFVQPKTNGLQVITENTAFSSVDITGSTFDPGTGLAAAIDLDVNNTASMEFNIIGNNSIKGKGINIINIFAFPSASFQGRINSNTVINNGGSGAGIRVVNQGNGNSRVEIKNNLVTGGDDYGITAGANSGSGRLDATITGNTVSLTSNGFYAIQTVAGVSSSVFTNKVCANVANNTTSLAAGAFGNYQGRSATPSHELLLQGAGATVAAIWNANSNLPVTPPAVISQSGTGVFTFGATCLLPLNSPVTP